MMAIGVVLMLVFGVIMSITKDYKTPTWLDSCSAWGTLFVVSIVVWLWRAMP